MPLPLQPSGLTLTPGSEQVTLRFSRGSGAARYDRQHRVRGTAWPVAFTSFSDPQDVATGLTNGVEYEFRVRSVNDDGPSAWLEGAASATPLLNLATLPAPTTLSADPESGQIRVGWDLPAGAADGTTRYELAYGRSNAIPTPGSAAHTIIPDLTARSQIIDNLTNGTTYYAWVRTLSATGPSAWTASGAVRPLLTAGPPAPTLTAERGSEQAQITIGAVADAIHYEYAYRGGSTTRPAESPSVDYTVRQVETAGEIVVPHLDNGTAYTFWARAHTPAGHGPWSSAATVTPSTAAAGVAPTNIVINASDAAVLIRWEAVAGAIEYDYAFGTSTFAAAEKVLTPNDIEREHVVIAGLQNDQATRFWIRAVSAIGPGPWSLPQIATPSASKAPLPPTDLTFLVTATTVQVYGVLNRPPANPMIRCRYRVAGTSAWTVLMNTVPMFPVTIPALSENTEYEVQANITGDGGTSVYSPSYRVATFSVPSSLTGTPRAGRVELGWDLDEVVDGYDVRYRAEGEADDEWVLLTDATIAEGVYAIGQGLANGIRYEFQVRAKRDWNSYLYSEWTTSLVMTPFVVQAAKPENLVALPGPLEALLQWSVADGAQFYDYRFRRLGGDWTQVNDITNTEAVVRNLVAGLTYEFQIRASNGVGGITDWSESVETTVRNQILTVPGVAEIEVRSQVNQDIRIDLANNTLYPVRVQAFLEPELPGREFSHSFQLPDDFVKMVEFNRVAVTPPGGEVDVPLLTSQMGGAGGEQGTTPATYEIDGDLLYTEVETPVIRYLARGREDDLRGSFALIAELLMAIALAWKYEPNTPLAAGLSQEYRMHLLPSMLATVPFFDARLLTFDTYLAQQYGETAVRST